MRRVKAAARNGLWLLVWLALAALGPAQAQTLLRGVVRDAVTNEPLQRVSVALRDTPHQTRTDRDGSYTLSGVAPGVYLLQASTVGYRLLSQEVTIAAQENFEIQLSLVPEYLRQTASIDVTASLSPFETARADGPAELDLRGAEMKNLASVLTDDPLRALQSLPGVTSSNDLDSRFALRGAGFQYVGLYLDDVLLHAPFHGINGEFNNGSLTMLSGDTLDTAALHNGGQPSRFADRLGGIVDLTTREGNRDSTHFRGTVSASHAGALAEGPLGANRRGSWLVSIRKSYIDYLVRRIAEDPTFAFGLWDVSGKLAYTLHSRHQLSLHVLHGGSGLDREDYIPRAGINAIIFSDYQLTTANLGWRYAAGESLLITNRVAFLRERSENQNREVRPLLRGAYGEWVWTANGSKIWGGRHPLSFGASVRRVRDDGFENRYQFNPAAVQRLEEFRGDGLRSGAYLQQGWSGWSGRVSLSAGARWDYHSVNSVPSLAPQASAAFQVLPGTRLQLAWGQYAQYPDVMVFFSRVGSRNLLPERSQHVLVSLEQRLGSHARIRADVYQRLDRDLLFRPFLEPRVRNGVIYNPPAFTPILNALRGYSRGMQIFAQSRSANRLAGWVSYSLNYTRYREGYTGAAFPSDFAQRHLFNVYLGYRIRPSVNLSAKWVAGSGLPIPGFFRQSAGVFYLAPNRNQETLDTYQRLDLRINKAFPFRRAKLTLFGEVINVFNRDNQILDSFNGYDRRTGVARLSFLDTFPIIPAAGLMVEF